MFKPLTVAVIHTFNSTCRCHETLLAACRALGHRTVTADSERLPAALRRLRKADLAFDHTDTYHGAGALRARVRLMIEQTAIPIVGSPASVLADCDDKTVTKRLLRRLEIPTPACAVIHSPFSIFPSPLRLPLVLKPSTEHGSRGLTLVRRRRDWRPVLRSYFRRWNTPALAERFVAGREISLSLIGPRPEVLPPQETLLSPGTRGLYTRAAKSGPDSLAVAHGSVVVPAALPPRLRRRLDTIARRIWRHFGLREYARIDLRIGRGHRPYVLEINATPGIEAGGEFLAAAAQKGMTPEDVVGELIESRLGREYA